MVLQARAYGYDALAITDHDNLGGAMEFARAAKEFGARPIPAQGSPSPAVTT